jgi:hypothetical protein
MGGSLAFRLDRVVALLLAGILPLGLTEGGLLCLVATLFLGPDFLRPSSCNHLSVSFAAETAGSISFSFV